MPNKFDEIHSEMQIIVVRRLEKFISLLKSELSIDLENVNKEDLKKIKRSLPRLIKKSGLDSLHLTIEEFFVAVEKESTRLLAASSKVSIAELNKHIIDYAETIAETGLADDIDKITDDLRKNAKKKLTIKNTKGLTKKELSANIGELLALPKARLETATRTAVMGYDRAVTIGKASAVGIEKYKWMGQLNSNTTDFCRKRHNKIYTEKQIRGWKNGMKEPAWIYGHGYNCTHRPEAQVI